MCVGIFLLSLTCTIVGEKAAPMAVPLIIQLLYRGIHFNYFEFVSAIFQQIKVGIEQEEVSMAEHFIVYDLKQVSLWN